MTICIKPWAGVTMMGPIQTCLVAQKQIEHRRALGGGFQIEGKLLEWERLRSRPGQHMAGGEIFPHGRGQRLGAVGT